VGPATTHAGPESATEAEAALVARARSGDRAALEAIVRAHAPAVQAIVQGYVERGEADDVAQEVFLRVVQGLPGFDGRARLGTWIFRVATNVGLNAARSRRRKPRPASLPEDAPLVAAGPEPGANLDAREERAAFLRALDALPDEFRAVVVLRVHRGLSFEAIAEVLGIARPTAESRMARAKDRLRGLLAPRLDKEQRP
jgi:RNA polymerase sigma-70 factor (ECF subfamily)